MKLETIKSRCTECGDCWLWQGATDGHGRPQVRHKGAVVYVRRLVRELTDGKPIPAGKVVATECGSKLCVSPQCSVTTSSKGKAKLAAARGAYSRPDKLMRMVATKRANSDISDELVEQIRLAPGPSSRISAETKVSLSHVKAIRNGTARRDYRNPFAQLMKPGPASSAPHCADN